MSTDWKYDESDEREVPEEESPQDFREVYEELLHFYDGNSGGYAVLDEELNLNALAIGLGLENIEYEPERFPGLVFRHRDLETSTILFHDGHLMVVDAPSDEVVEKAVQVTVNRIGMLGMLEEDEDVEVVEFENTVVDDSIQSFPEE